MPFVEAQDSFNEPVTVYVGVWIVSVEQVDLAANSYKLDFYLWFGFNSSSISLEEARQFEFTNGSPEMYEVDSNEQGYLEYRVKGVFTKTFDFADYPFESQELAVRLEHKSLNSSALIYLVSDVSGIDKEASVAGWNLHRFRASVSEHLYDSESYSRFSAVVVLQRPFVSSFVKSVLPIMIITAISLLAFFMVPADFAQKISLGVTTLLAATAFHLSLVNGIPPTGYLTFADGMMVGIYVIFLYNLSASVYIMRLVKKGSDKAEKFNYKALRILPIFLSAVVAVVVLTQLIG
jgi:hypothetical protein